MSFAVPMKYIKLNLKTLETEFCTEQTLVDLKNGKKRKKNELSDIERNTAMPRE